MSESSPELQSPATSSIPVAGDKRAWLAWGVLAGIWFLLLDQLRLEWSTNADYSYGFIVPLLAVYLFFLRWQSDAPAPLPPLEPPPPQLLPLLGLLALCLLPVRLVQVATPEWRFVNWTMAVLVIGISFGLVWWRCGARWAWHLAFPLAFLFTAVPWPTLLEGPLTRSLMQHDTGFSVFLLNWAGIPAVQIGNVIQVGRDTVGVSEACSGIRSLQVTWMSAWFLGELYRYSLNRRFMLVGFGIIIALVCNLGRTCLLTWITVQHGPAMMEKWHDNVGLSALAITLGMLWGLASWMNPARRAEVSDSPPAAPTGKARPWPRAFILATAGWLVVVIAGTEAWYRSHEMRRPSSAPAWNVAWPVNAPAFKEIEIPAIAQSFLKYTQGRNASWRGPRNELWTVFFFQWAPGRTSAALARGHRPEICLPSVGCSLEREAGIETYALDGLELPLRHLIFKQGGRSLHVWWCLWDEAQQGRDTETGISSYRSILNAVTRGQRNLGQQVLEIALSGPEDSDAARAELERLLPGLIVPRTPFAAQR